MKLVGNLMDSWFVFVVKIYFVIDESVGNDGLVD